MIEDMDIFLHYPILERCYGFTEFDLYLVDSVHQEYFSNYSIFRTDPTKIVVHAEEYWKLYEEYYDSVTAF